MDHNRPLVNVFCKEEKKGKERKRGKESKREGREENKEKMEREVEEGKGKREGRRSRSLSLKVWVEYLKYLLSKSRLVVGY